MTSRTTRGLRRNFLRAGDRRAFFEARRDGALYCTACGCYRQPREFTGDTIRTCDACRGLHRCSRCQLDQPIGQFNGCGHPTRPDDICHTCRSYRPLAHHEQATLAAFVAAEEPATASAADDGVSLGRDPRGRPVRLTPAQRSRHLYLIGKPGSGAATLMKSLFVQDMVAGRGCAFLDLQGDAALELLALVPPARFPAVTYFDPARGLGPTFNPLALPHAPHVVADDIVSTFKMLFPDTLDPAAEQLLHFGILTLLGDHQPHTLADLYTFFVAPSYRDGIAAASPSPRLRGFWQHEFPPSGSDLAQLIAGKLEVVLTPFSPLERLLSITENSLDFDALLTGRQALVANLSTAALGAEAARLLGGLLTAAIARATQARAERLSVEGPTDEPHDFDLFVPDFHEYAIPALEPILSGNSSHHLNLILAQQSVAQLPAVLQRTILDGVGTVVAFQVDGEDAEHLRRTMSMRHPARVSTGDLYDHEEARRAAAEPVRRSVREFLAAPHTFAGESEASYEGRRLDQLLAEIEAVRHLPFPDDLVEIEWPTTFDFTDSPRGTAFVRTEGCDHVITVIVDPLPLPDAHSRDLILSRPRRRVLPERSHFEAKQPATLPVRHHEQAVRPRGWPRAGRAVRRLGR